MRRVILDANLKKYCCLRERQLEFMSCDLSFGHRLSPYQLLLTTSTVVLFLVKFGSFITLSVIMKTILFLPWNNDYSAGIRLKPLCSITIDMNTRMTQIMIFQPIKIVINLMVTSFAICRICFTLLPK